MNGSIIIWGQETVPDLRGFAFANGPVGKTDDEAREAICDKFTKYIYHLIVCIGAHVAWPKGNCWVGEAMGADLCDALSSYSSGARATLNEISRIMGIPGKPDGIDGGQVEKYFSGGTIREFAEYCESDVINTSRPWLRYGWRLTGSAQQASELSLHDFIKRHENTKQRDMVAGPAP